MMSLPSWRFYFGFCVQRAVITDKVLWDLPLTTTNMVLAVGPYLLPYLPHGRRERGAGVPIWTLTVKSSIIFPSLWRVSNVRDQYDAKGRAFST